MPDFVNMLIEKITANPVLFVIGVLLGVSSCVDFFIFKYLLPHLINKSGKDGNEAENGKLSPLLIRGFVAGGIILMLVCWAFVFLLDSK